MVLIAATGLTVLVYGYAVYAYHVGDLVLGEVRRIHGNLYMPP